MFWLKTRIVLLACAALGYLYVAAFWVIRPIWLRTVSAQVRPFSGVIPWSRKP
ncbi:MAG: hypothetical protein ACRYFU_06875 [Janthinobacterium lividum]